MTRREEIDVDDVLFVVGDNLGKADACITAAERLFGQPGASAITDDDDDDGDDGECGHDDDNDPDRVRNNLEHLVECTKLAVRAAQYSTRTVRRSPSSTGTARSLSRTTTSPLPPLPSATVEGRRDRTVAHAIGTAGGAS